MIAVAGLVALLRFRISGPLLVAVAATIPPRIYEIGRTIGNSQATTGVFRFAKLLIFATARQRPDHPFAFSLPADKVRFPCCQASEAKPHVGHKK